MKNIFVGNIGYNTSEEALRQLLGIRAGEPGQDH